MPEKGWYALTVRKETALRVRELARNKGLTMDEFINMFLEPASKEIWVTCSLYGAKVKAGNKVRHVSKVHPRTVVR